MATDFDRAKALDFHAAACADALQHYPELPSEALQYLAGVLICEYPEVNPMSYVYEPVFSIMLYHPVRVLLVRGKCPPWEIVGAARNYVQIVTREDNYFGHTPRAVSDELMKFYEQS